MNHISKLPVSHHRAESDRDLNVYCRHLHSIIQNPCRGNAYITAVSSIRAPFLGLKPAGRSGPDKCALSLQGRVAMCALALEKVPSLGSLLSSSHERFGGVLVE